MSRVHPAALLALALGVLGAAPAGAEVRLRTRTITASAAGLPLPAGDPATLVVQAGGGVTAAWKRALAAEGARLVTYLPDDAYLVRVPRARAAALARVAGTALAAAYLPGDKLAPELAAAIDAHGAARTNVDVLVAPDAPAARVAADLRELGLDVAAAGGGPVFQRIAASLPPGRLDLAERAAGHPDVLWIEPRARRVLLNDAGIWVCQSGTDGGMTTPVFDHGIYGAGQTVAVLDTGLDWDMCYFREPSGTPPPVNKNGGTLADPTRRKVVAYDMVYAGDDPSNPLGYDNHGHGTHVAGTVAGDNLANPIQHDLGDGMAPAAKLVAQDGGYIGPDNCSDLAGLGCPVIDLTPIFDQAYRQGARFHSNSWGDRENFMPQNTYTAACVDTDDFMWTHPDFLILYAAGNSGPGYDTVGSPSVAKDTVSVGATQHDLNGDSLAGFSSWGNAADGRIKPTVTAPGVSVVSADDDRDIRTGNCGTVAFSGTSMACPTAAGLSTLVAEYYAAGFYPGRLRNPADGFAPSAALVKATLMNGARPMKNELAIPSRTQGWGRITLGDVLAFRGSPRDLFAVDEKTGFATGATSPMTYTVEVKSAAQPLKATLVWTDPPSNPMAATNLIDDLDLRVSGPSGTFLGNVFAGGFSQAGGIADRLNVEEQVRIASPLPGTYTIEVVPHAVPQGPQPFALVVTGDLPTPLYVAYASYAVAQDQNANGWPDPGETVRLAVSLSNPSDEAATGVTGTLQSLSPDVTVTDASASWPDIAAGAAAASLADHFEVKVSSAVACGAKVPMKLVATAGGKPFEATFDLLVGGFTSVIKEDFDATPDGTTPAGWTVVSNRPASGKVRADATVEPVVTSPGPTSKPNALFVGKDGADSNFTRTDAQRQLDLSAYAGRPAILSFRWWVRDAPAGQTLTVSLSDSGPLVFGWDLLRTTAPYDSTSDGGNLWGTTSVDLSTLTPPFAAGKDVWIQFEGRVTSSEPAQGYYIDDLDVRSVTCQAVAGCTQVVADASATSAQPSCPNTAVTLDGTRSRATGCATLAYRWYDGATLVATGAVATVYPLRTTTYRLEVECASPPSCTSSDTTLVPVLSATLSSVQANSLRALAQGSSVALSWAAGTGSGFNVASSAVRSDVATLWTLAALNPTPLAMTSYTAAPPASAIVYFQAFGTNSCNGRSVP